MRNAYKISVGKLEEKRPFRWPRRRWDANIRMDFRGIWWEYLYWLHMSRDREHWRNHLHMVMNLQVPLKTENFLN